jgi:hypothetical protein
MTINETEPTKKQYVKAFLDLHFKIYKNNFQWIPSLAVDERKMTDRNRHVFFQKSDANYFMDFSESGECFERPAVLDNQRYNQHNGSNTVFFYLGNVLIKRTINNLFLEKMCLCRRYHCIDYKKRRK